MPHDIIDNQELHPADAALLNSAGKMIEEERGFSYEKADAEAGDAIWEEILQGPVPSGRDSQDQSEL
jgi:hypothetical protein